MGVALARGRDPPGARCHRRTSSPEVEVVGKVVRPSGAVALPLTTTTSAVAARARRERGRVPSQWSRRCAERQQRRGRQGPAPPSALAPQFPPRTAQTRHPFRVLFFSPSASRFAGIWPPRARTRLVSPSFAFGFAPLFPRLGGPLRLSSRSSVHLACRCVVHLGRKWKATFLFVYRRLQYRTSKNLDFDSVRSPNGRFSFFLRHDAIETTSTCSGRRGDSTGLDFLKIGIPHIFRLVRWLLVQVLHLK